ncbi:MAG: LPS export ABC transporter ATP-binding protein, partial [Lentisphaeria bacterium]
MNQNKTPLLVADGLVKAYHGRRVVNGASLTVQPGEIVVLPAPLGPSRPTISPGCTVKLAPF